MVGIKPASLSFEQAGSLPLVALTSFQALRNYTAPGFWDKKPTVFIASGSGGTGFLALQMARAFGAGKIITCTSTENMEFARQMGATQVIDYKKQNWTEIVPEESVDLFYENHAEDPEAMMKVLRGGG